MTADGKAEYVQARRVGGRYRVCWAGRRAVALNEQGSPFDGGGHRRFWSADVQAGALNKWFRDRARKEAECAG